MIWWVCWKVAILHGLLVSLKNDGNKRKSRIFWICAFWKILDLPRLMPTTTDLIGTRKVHQLKCQEVFNLSLYLTASRSHTIFSIRCYFFHEHVYHISWMNSWVLNCLYIGLVNLFKIQYLVLFAILCDCHVYCFACLDGDYMF